MPIVRRATLQKATLRRSLVRKLALGLLAFSVSGLAVLSFVEGHEARLAQALLTGLAPASLLALAGSTGGRPRLAVSTALLLGAVLSSSLLGLVALQGSSSIEGERLVGIAVTVMIVGLVLVPLALMGWSFAAAAGRSATGDDPA